MIGRCELWSAVHHDLVDKCAATAPHVSQDLELIREDVLQDLYRIAKRDLETVERRFEAEGESFFTLTLPAFGKEFLRALDRGCLLGTDFQGWRRVIYTAGNTMDDRTGPSFLHWAFQVVFAASHKCSAEPDNWHPCLVPTSGESGLHVRDYHWAGVAMADDEWAAESVHAILQLSGLYSKEKRLASDARNRAALEQYVRTDRELADVLEGENFPLILDRAERVKKVISLVFAGPLSRIDREVMNGELLPKHGPGATADKLVGNEKWLLTEWTERLERLFTHEEYLFPSDSILRDSTESIKLLAPGDERPSKVILVPKTAASPRVIAIEPTCMQYVQQGFLRSLVPALEADKSSKDFVGFTDQEPNQRLAAYGSAEGGLATLDLSEASDRVANWLVEELFADFPWFLEGIQACRSTHASLPDGRVIELVKYASMGSALTFPLEAMVFSAICIEAVCRALSMPLSSRSIRSLRGRVRVYGDDIIVPVDCAEQVVESLEIFGFKVNRTKSFWTGEFRESCGREYWRGLDVSHIKVRSEFPTDLHSAEEAISTLSTRNQLFEAGFVVAVDFLDGVLHKVFRGRYPIVEATSPLLGRLALDPPSGECWDKDHHVPLARGYKVVAKSPVNSLDGPRALLKFFLSPSKEADHLTRSGRPRAVRMKLVMGPVY